MGQFSGLSQPRSLRGNFRDFLNPDRSGGTQVDFSAAVFATGKVGDWLFTGAFNSERPINQDCEGRNRLFGGIQFCEQQYPVYGDSSTFTSTTPSIDSFYARFERTSSIPGADPDYVMWGDYNTQEFARASQLYTATSRQLHGFKANYNFGPLQITGLFANNIEGFQRDTIVPNGLSGNYFLSKRLLVPGSESVFLEAEEINRPGTVIQRQQLFRGPDYEIDYDRGTLLFRRPILATELNPFGATLVRRIVVTYQNEGGQDSQLYGGRLQYNISQDLESKSFVGASYLLEDQGSQDFELFGADFLLSFGDVGKVVGEYARSNGTLATIRRNRIYYHDGSAIITSVRGENTLVQENIIVGNGIAGMPDALRIEGVVDKSQITGNLICANDGAGVYLFKPKGSIQIRDNRIIYNGRRFRDNRIIYNGRRLRRAAVYLMGSDHQVTGNEISYQTGSGVVVSAFPHSVRNIIQKNSFAALEGLSIDLNTQRNLDVSYWQRGDGPNPQRNSGNRRLETGNAAINAPEFKTRQFFPSGNAVTLQGKADPGSEVTIYRLGDYQQTKKALYEPGYGALSQPLASTPVDDKGNFSVTVENLQLGDIVSAIATDPRYGTSEPAIAAFIGPRSTSPQLTPKIPLSIPQCTSRPAPPLPPTPPIPPTPPTIIEPPTPLRIRAPRNVHFALDKSFISPASAIVLDRVAQVLQQYPSIVIEIQGHTDPRASNAYNEALGRRRALATRNYLLRQGVSPERMTIRSLGETQRVTEGNSRLDYARDRRAEIIYKDVRGIDIIIEGQQEDLQLEPPRGRR